MMATSRRTRTTSLRTRATTRPGHPIAAESSWAGWGVKLSSPSGERLLLQGSECRGEVLRRSCTGLRILATALHVGPLSAYTVYDGTRMDGPSASGTMLLACVSSGAR